MFRVNLLLTLRPGAPALGEVKMGIVTDDFAAKDSMPPASRPPGRRYNRRILTMIVRAHIENLWLFLRSGAPLSVSGVYCRRLLLKGLAALSGKTAHSSSELMNRIDSEGAFTTRWFDRHASEWMGIFESEGLIYKPMTILEIGSWEGRSTCFFLQYLRSAHITAVDTWQGGDEHASYTQVGEIERLFGRNVARFGDRVTKAKSTSLEYFSKRDAGTLFDLIYVDGSHRADDVMIDAIQSFAALKPGGILIFDDYTFLFYERMKDNSVFPLNCFLKMKQREFTILSVTSQLFLKKRATSDLTLRA